MDDVVAPSVRKIRDAIVGDKKTESSDVSNKPSNKLYCRHCGTLIDANSKFCSHCGKEQ